MLGDGAGVSLAHVRAVRREEQLTFESLRWIDPGPYGCQDCARLGVMLCALCGQLLLDGSDR
jgi:hypothetical protein